MRSSYWNVWPCDSDKCIEEREKKRHLTARKKWYPELDFTDY